MESIEVPATDYSRRREVSDAFLGEGGEMGALCRALDWSVTPLGPVTGWTQSLRTTVSTILRSRHPMFLFWGPDLVQIYNDGYRPSLGEGGRHPRALGMRGAEFWTEIWDIIGPQIEDVMTSGAATWHEDQLVAIERNGRIEEVYWTYSYSPVRDDDGSIGGTLVVCQETTQRVIAERRLRTLHRLAALRTQGSAGNAAEETVALLAAVDLDAPFVICYLSLDDDDTAAPVLHCGAGLDCDIEPDRWPLHDVMAERTARIVDVRGWPEIAGAGPWPEDPMAAMVLPLAPTDAERALGALVVGISPRLPLSTDYREFLKGAAHHVGAKVMSRVLQGEREQHERELDMERARLAFVFEQAPAFLAVMRGASHTFERVNEAYNRLVGPRDLIGKPAAEALPEIREQGFTELLDHVLETGEPFVGREVPVMLARSREGEPEQRFLDFVYIPLQEADGSRSGVIAHGTDVTMQVRARREVERLLDESETARSASDNANRAKTRFLANMSHELRTPINAVIGYADLLETGIHGELNPDQRLDIQRIMASSRHLAGLVNEILDLAKIEAGGMEVEHDPIPVSETVQQALDMIVPAARKRGVILDSESGCASDATYVGDPDRARQVLVNLLSNAVKFTPSGGRVAVSCSLHEGGGPSPGDGAWVQVVVEDNGIGIAPEHLERIFEPFVQVDDTRTRATGGTGLGLTISRRLTRMMDGDLTVESQPGIGSRFTLWLRAGG